ncbi:uncharacterized protein LOC144711146 [Wolffia australiana]
MKHLMEAPPSPTAPHYEQWLDVEGVVHRWLLDSISSSYAAEFLSLNSAKEIWDAAQESHSKRNNLAIIYDLVTRSTNLTQGPRSVRAYHLELSSLWAELGHYMPPDPHSVDRGYVLELRVFKFLMGLNLEYESLRGQLLHREKVPTLKEALVDVQMDETRLGLFHSEPALAMAVKQLGSSRPTSVPVVSPYMSSPKVSSPNMNSPVQQSASTSHSAPGNSSIFCNYCKKRGHTKETCYKLQQKNAHQSHLVSHLPPQSRQFMTPPTSITEIPQSTAPPTAEATSLKIAQLRHDEIDQLRQLLQSKFMDSTSFVHQGVRADDYTC